MKLLVFAHTPPPHHGQSYMVQVMLEGLGGGRRKGAGGPAPHGIECHHVNAQLASGMEDIGRFRPGKLLNLLGYCLQAIWRRFRYGVRNFYYVPAPGLKNALLRDWIVMALCRPFFKRVIFHWHTFGTGEWLENQPCPHLRRWSFFCLSRSALSIVLAEFNGADAAKFKPRRMAVVPYGIPDPCPDFDSAVLGRRRKRMQLIERAFSSDSEQTVINVLFLALCSKGKGLHDAVRAVHFANQTLVEKGRPSRFRLRVAGKFLNPQEEADFQALIEELGAGDEIEYLGFLKGDEKRRVLIDSDILCFPTWYFAEAQPVILLEALAFGLPVVTTQWRAVPEILPDGYPGVVPIKDPAATARALVSAAAFPPEKLRERFLAEYTVDRHLSTLAAALRSVENS